MQKKVQRKLTLQFTLIVSALIFAGGLIYITADFINARYQTGKLLQIKSERIVRRISNSQGRLKDILVGRDAQMGRVIDPEGKILFTGSILRGFSDPIPLDKTVAIEVDSDPYLVLSTPIEEGSKTIGYLQLAEPARIKTNEMFTKTGIFFLVTLMFSIATYLLGFFFVRRNLRPITDTLARQEQFIQDASHELKTPLANINSSVDVAIKTKNYQEGLLAAKQEVVSASVLIDRLLELAKLDALSLEITTVELKDVINELIKKYEQEALGKNVELRVSLSSCIVKADPILAARLFGNLIENAIKFSKASSDVHIVLSRNAFSVENEGAIEKDDLPRIFDAFYQADPSRSQNGFGLGLTVVRNIAISHGWRVSADSNGSSTTFLVNF